MRIDRTIGLSISLAIAYPAALVIFRQSTWIPDLVLVLVCIAVIVAAIVEFARDKPQSRERHVLALNVALFGSLFLSHLIDKPHSALTVFMGAAFALQVIGLAALVWKQKRENNPELRIH